MIGTSLELLEAKSISQGTTYRTQKRPFRCPYDKMGSKTSHICGSASKSCSVSEFVIPHLMSDKKKMLFSE